MKIEDYGVIGDMHRVGANLQQTVAELEKKMRESAANLEFEEAARYRDELRRLESIDLEIPNTAAGRAGMGLDGKPLPPQVKARSTGGRPGQRPKFAGRKRH